MNKLVKDMSQWCSTASQEKRKPNESFLPKSSTASFPSGVPTKSLCPCLNLSCADSSLLMPHPCWILQTSTTFGESDTHLLTFLKSPSNIGLHWRTPPREGFSYFETRCTAG
ncbi:hypothetical protein H5410_048881 [Solanum commersonii]|uniref:Uncharacterized protein n=1 Tax=Solanum commersonii TaxID=4109 RepID=A0A9J5XLT9_SOLCO|nr:hypothetical protein H5410_048881 [Solanum commersonii]